MPPGSVPISFLAAPSVGRGMWTYDVVDQHVDPVPTTDVWAVYLAARFAKREELYESFTAPEKELIRKELRRIRHLREYFFSYRLTPSDHTLNISLERAHSYWRQWASQRCKKELERCASEISRAGNRRLQLLNRNRTILTQVQQWQSQAYMDFQQQISPVSYISGLEAADGSMDDDQRQPEYGSNSWLIVFEKGCGGVTLDNPLCHGRFPHQKIPLQKLLYAKETPLKRSGKKEQFRYFHLPANNMKWVEVSRSTYIANTSSNCIPGRNLGVLRGGRLQVCRASGVIPAEVIPAEYPGVRV